MSSSTPTTFARVLAAPRRLVGAAGSNFYYSFLLLPKAKRRAITDVYRFARLLDDIVDEEAQGRDPYAELQAWRDEIEFIYRGVPATEFGDHLMLSIEEFDLPKQPFLDLVDGMEMDLKWHSYQSFADLREYCYRAASTVGLICIEIFGYENARTREYAVNLGLALQLTNILRDLKEDIARDRIYLPLEDLERFGYTADDLRAHRYNQPFIELMKYEYQRARSYFMKAAASLPEPDRPSMFAAEIMATIYREILEQMPVAQFDVFRNRLSVPKKRRIKIALEIWFRSKLRKP
jgi:phytoene synthase